MNRLRRWWRAYCRDCALWGYWSSGAAVLDLDGSVLRKLMEPYE